MLVKNDFVKNPQTWCGLNRPGMKEEEADVVIFGIPFDGGVSYRGGAAEAPETLRENTLCSTPCTERLQWFGGLNVVDAGCGEGFYGLAVERRLREIGADGQVLAFDIASDAVKVAARSDAPVKWMVADITNIPVKDGAADVVLDVFTPANYGEFARILAEDGVVIKVVPGANHMAQLRAAAAKQLRSEAYSNEDVLDYFLERFDLLERFTVSRTVPVDRERLADLVNMTPVLFDVDKGLLDLSAVTEITVEGEIVAGRPRNGQDFS